MQTFLPYPSFVESARSLDRLRLGKQRVEAKQILNTILGVSSGWRHHPAVRMWSGYPRLLSLYGWVMCQEWLRRNCKDTLQPFFLEMVDTLPEPEDVPRWLGDERLHRSHQSKLYHKNPDHYCYHFGTQPVIEYYWPV